ncbi:restriction endonuclease subunit R, partial [Candidatus Uhrbacteria bacterium CG_4_9_14_3_um_filter_50_9]
GIDVVKKLHGLNFTVEMETGTGKTYVYTKAMFELNKLYGWNKFIIMVPSIAIREGVHKSLQITADHFQQEYGKKLRYFIYDTKNKSNLTNIKNFAQTGNIEVIIMNYQAFGRKSKDALKMYQKLDELQSERPIDIIKRARPILIIDEPQRFGKTANKMLAEFNPLIVTRYSATHKKDEEYNKIYRLDAIDAYNQKLVKKIKVKGIEVKGNSGTNSYVFLDRIHVSDKSYPTATIQMEFEQKQGAGIKKVLKRVKEKDNLFDLSGGLAQYKNQFVVSEINANTNTIKFLNGIELQVGQVLGDIDELHVRTIQIREAIASHLEKERALFDKGIKVLTLFFIDEVAKYRAYDDKGNQVKAVYEEIFEREYKEATAQLEFFSDEYRTYIDKHPVGRIHKGYFSIDKKDRAIDSQEKRGENGSDDVAAYDLIMKDKERLLSFEEPTRFIFSHSALREGWDNPNIFQICTLKHAQAEMSKRQEIGRGLRIAVNSNGDRMDTDALEHEFFDINTLTVIASESYDEFAKQLQKEILSSLSNRPTILEVDVLKDRVMKNKDGDEFVFTSTKAMDLISDFKAKGYLDADYKVTNTLVSAIESSTLEVAEELKPFVSELSELVMKIHATATYSASDDDRVDNVDLRHVTPNENFAKKEFQDLWSKIKVKTVYDVSFDTQELIKSSISAIDADLAVQQVTIRITEGEQVDELSQDKLATGDSLKRGKSVFEKAGNLLGTVRYDLIKEVAKDTNCTRQTIATILQKISPEKFVLFKVNPEHFIREVSRFINEQKASMLINKIVYRKTDQTYDTDIFTINNLKGSLDKDVLEVKKHIYQYVKTDSAVERVFARELDNEGSPILVFAKLPSDFKIDTPVGNYNPDWAIVFDEADVKHIYFIAETKGSMSTMQLKKIEQKKIEYAKKHFELLAQESETQVKYDVVDNYESLLNKVMR